MKKYLLYAYILTLTTMLFGCSAKDSDGFFYNTFTKNMDVFLAYINNYIGGLEKCLVDIIHLWSC